VIKDYNKGNRTPMGKPSGITTEGKRKEIIKVKGYKNKDQLFKNQLNFNSLESLLYLNNNEINKTLRS
jgi:hypothetical protein